MVTGGVPLFGDVHVSGSKNAALPIIAAALLTREECIIDNLPIIEDVCNMLEVLRQLGADVDLDEAEHRVRIRAGDLTSYAVP